MWLSSSRAYSSGSGPPNPPLTLPLVTASTPVFAHLGQFATPVAFNSGGSALAINPLPNGGGGVMWISSQQTDDYGAITLPTLAQIKAGGASASTLVAPVAMPNDIDAANGLQLNGALYANGSVYLTKNSFYPGPQQTAVIAKLSTDLTSIGTACPMSGDAPLGQSSRFYAGQLSAIPALWQPYLGGDTLVVMGPGQGIISQSVCCGIGVSAFNIGDVGSGGAPVTARDFAGWTLNAGSATLPVWNGPSQNSRPNVIASVSGSVMTVSQVLVTGIGIGVNSWIMNASYQTPGAVSITALLAVNPDGTGTYQLSSAPGNSAAQPTFVSNTIANICPAGNPSALPNGGDDIFHTYDGPIGAGIFIPNSRSILIPSIACIGPHGGGVPEQGTCPLACNSGGSGTNDPRILRIFAYDAALLYSSKKAGNSVSSAMPYAIWDFPNWASIWPPPCGLNNWGTRSGWMCVDTLNSLLYAGLYRGGGQNTMHVFSISGL